MNWKFFASNWFSGALVLLVFLVVIRNQIFTSGVISAPLPARAGISAPLQETLGIGSTPGKKGSATALDQAGAEAFLKRFAHVAISERKKFGVPAAILLATAFLNSHAGTDAAAKEANNYFDVPCTDDWEGGTYASEDGCFRRYESAWEGWRDFSIHLSGQTWYGSLKKTAGKDWRKWAAGIQASDVSATRQFNKKLVEVIEYYQLDKIDQP